MGARIEGCIHLRRCRFSDECSLFEKHNKIREYARVFPDLCFNSSKSENREAPQKRRFLCRARQKAQEYLESLSSIFNAARRKKIPFEAVYP